MSVGGGGGSSSKTVVKPVSPKDLQNYFLTLDNLTATPGAPAPSAGKQSPLSALGGSLGGGKQQGPAGTPTQQGGRLLQFARQGTQGVDYNALTPAQLQALGGLGARDAHVDAAEQSFTTLARTVARLPHPAKEDARQRLHVLARNLRPRQGRFVLAARVFLRGLRNLAFHLLQDGVAPPGQVGVEQLLRAHALRQHADG